MKEDGKAILIWLFVLTFFVMAFGIISESRMRENKLNIQKTQNDNEELTESLIYEAEEWRKSLRDNTRNHRHKFITGEVIMERR